MKAEIGRRSSKIGKLTAQKISLMGIVLAIRIVLSFVPSLNMGNMIEMGFGFLGAILTGVMFGPWYGFIISVINDLLTFFLGGGSVFFPGFMLSAGLGGLIYGTVLWRKKITWKRLFIAVFLVTLIVNIALNSLWIRIMYDQAFAVIMPMRVIKNIISLPLNTILAGLLFKQPRVEKMLYRTQF